MVKTETPNYKERLSDVDRIVGEPTYTTLRRLEKEIRRNAGSIPSTEGGGELGHTFLVLNDETFQALPGAVAWQRPTHPGTLQIPVNATAAQVTTPERLIPLFFQPLMILPTVKLNQPKTLSTNPINSLTL